MPSSSHALMTTTVRLALFLVIPFVSMNGADTPAERLRKTLAGFAYSSTNVKNITSASSPPPQLKPASPKAEARPSDMPGLETRAKRSLVRKERGDEMDEDDTASALPQRSPSKKPKRSYADPSVYSHLRELNDYLRPELDGE
jgi:TDG/mug DNA glycosylase family protein